MENLYKLVKHEVDNFQRIRQGLINDIDALKYKISILDKTAFACEQDAKEQNNNYKNLLFKRIG
jgi:hypothetical protein